MNNDSQQPFSGPADFPEVGNQPDSSEVNQANKDRKGYQNPLYPNDSVTTAPGFINEIRSYPKGNETLYFIRAGLIQGSRKNEQGDWVGDITNCDLLVGSTLKKWAESMVPFKDALTGIKVTFTVRNLKFIPEIYEGKAVQNSRGVLESITIGHLDQ